jgi:transposase
MTTRDRVGHLLEQGKGVKEVATVLGISSATVCYHKRRLGYEMSQRFGCRYDWRAIQAYYDTGRSVRECEQRFGFTHGRGSTQPSVATLYPVRRRCPSKTCSFRCLAAEET